MMAVSTAAARTVETMTANTSAGTMPSPPDVTSVNNTAPDEIREQGSSIGVDTLELIAKGNRVGGQNRSRGVLVDRLERAVKRSLEVAPLRYPA